MRFVSVLFILRNTLNQYKNKKIVNFRMLKGILMGSSFEEKYFSYSKDFCNKEKFTIVYYHTSTDFSLYKS